jgi:trk system potassium uptake protein TrkA
MKLIIIGCGRWGAGLAQTLGRRGHAVTVVDQDPAAFERLGPSFKGQTVLGIGFDHDVLILAGIERADGLAAVTASDEVNVVTARIARQVFRVPRVVARLYDPRKAEIYRRLGLQTISTVTWGINRVADLLCYSELDVSQSLGGGEVDLTETEVPPLLVGQTVNELTLPGELHVVAVTRDGKTFLPASGMVFQAGDRVHLVLLAASVERVKTLLALK